MRSLVERSRGVSLSPRVARVCRYGVPLALAGIAAVLIAACAPNKRRGLSFILPDQYQPLHVVAEDKNMVQAPGLTTTHGTIAYTDDIYGWVKQFPYGSVQRDAILSHEQVHAKRQFEMG